MTRKEAAQLLLTVVKRTEEGRIPWSETAGDDAYEASFPNQTLRVVRNEGVDEAGDDYQNYYIEVLNEKGRLVETVYPWNIREVLPKGESPWQLTTILFQLARDQALGVNKTIQELFEQLGGPVDIPEQNKS